MAGKKSKKPKGKSGPARKTVLVIADKSMAALVKAAQEKPASGGSMSFKVPGDAIAGKILSMKEENGRFGAQTVLVLDTADGPRTVYANASMARGLEEGGAKIGKKCAIVFKDTVSTGRGRPFKIFSVVVK